MIMGVSQLSTKVEGRIKHHHGRIPGLCKVPLAVIGIIALLVLINVVVWVAAGVFLVIAPVGQSIMTTGKREK